MTAAGSTHDQAHGSQEYFPEAEQQGHLKDDAEAWHNVVAVLLLIVSVGVGLALITVVATS